MSAAPRDGPASPDDGRAGSLSAVRYDSFVVRLLSRPHHNGLVEGQVTHIASRRTLRFTDLQRGMAFMLAQLGRYSAPHDATASGPPPFDEGPASDSLPGDLR